MPDRAVAAVASAARPGGRFRVLVLDDDAATLLLEQRALEREGIAVVPASSAEQAAALIARDGVELLILDYRLSGAITGLDLFRRLRDEGHAMPAVLVTSFADETKIIEALRAGIRDVVPKSGDYLAYLPLAVHRIAGQLEAERQLARAATLQQLVERLRQQTRTLETVNAVGRRLSAELDLPTIVQSVTDACTSIVGAHVGAFVQRQGDEAVVLAVAGVGRDGVGPPGSRAGDLFDPARVAAGTVLRADVAAEDGRPDAGVRSFLGVPVVTRVEDWLGGLFFGHREPGAFQERDARTVEGIAAQAATAIDNARLVEALRTSEDRLRLATDAASLGTWDYRPGAGTLALSERARALVALPEAPVDGLASLLGALDAGDRSMVEARIREALDPAGAGELRAECRTGPASGGRWLRLDGQAFFEHGRAVRLVGIVQDVTDERQRLEEREALLASERAARAELERTNRLKDEFLATLSHELRTPLNAVLGWSQLLRARARSPAELADGLDTIERNARAQAQIIDDLLDMSRIISGKLRLDVQPVDLRGLALAALDTVRPAAEAKQIALEATLDADAAPLTGDAGRLQQVLWNLLSNAIKFTPPTGRVRVRLSRVGTTTELTVSDTGQGITAEFLPFVFGRFQQADASTTREHRGMGLGLSIVKNLVEMHGGSVTAQSEGEGRGATFTVRLPAVAAWRPSGPAAERLATVRPARPLSAAAALSGVRVLLVDDEPDARELVARVLREQGAEVECAASVRDAVQAIARLLPDVLVSDIGMAGEDGYALVRALRARPRERGGAIPAIALTAFARDEDRERALAAGYQAHLAKPLDAPALIAAVAELARAAVRGAEL